MYAPEPANGPWLSNGLQQVSGLATFANDMSNTEYFDYRKYLKRPHLHCDRED